MPVKMMRQIVGKTPIILPDKINNPISIAGTTIIKKNKYLKNIPPFKKSGRRLVIGDQHKTGWLGGLLFNLPDRTNYDLEPMAPGARHEEKRKATFSDVRTGRL
jgi:hypothetical protein